MTGIRVLAVSDVRAVMAVVVERRRALGLQQQQVADAADIHAPTYAHFENGAVFPPSRELARILRALGLRLTAVEVP